MLGGLLVGPRPVSELKVPADIVEHDAQDAAVDFDWRRHGSR